MRAKGLWGGGQRGSLDIYTQTGMTEDTERMGLTFHVLSTSHALFYMTLTADLKKLHHYLHFTDDKTEVCGDSVPCLRKYSRSRGVRSGPTCGASGAKTSSPTPDSARRDSDCIPLGIFPNVPDRNFFPARC